MKHTPIQKTSTLLIVLLFIVTTVHTLAILRISHEQNSSATAANLEMSGGLMDNRDLTAGAGYYDEAPEVPDGIIIIDYEMVGDNCIVTETQYDNNGNYVDSTSYVTTPDCSLSALSGPNTGGQVTIGNADGFLMIGGTSSIKVMQMKLWLVGSLQPVDITGFNGPKTKAGILDFQIENKLPQTGTFDRATEATMDKYIGSFKTVFSGKDSEVFMRVERSK